MTRQRTRYEDNRPYPVPEALTELTGPAGGSVTLPRHLDWSEQGTYHLDDPAELRLMYERVIREAVDADDLRNYLDGRTLRLIWRRLFLPTRVRSLWEARFPDLSAAE